MTSVDMGSNGVPQIHNVVATIQIECTPINIERLSQLLPFSSYDKAKFAAITLRLLNPTCTCLLFTSGRCCCILAHMPLEPACQREHDVVYGYLLRLGEIRALE